MNTFQRTGILPKAGMLLRHQSGHESRLTRDWGRAPEHWDAVVEDRATLLLLKDDPLWEPKPARTDASVLQQLLLLHGTTKVIEMIREYQMIDGMTKGYCADCKPGSLCARVMAQITGNRIGL